jgi:cellulose synthase/poly-beta-1,6-N-acetylglucosamine synthase-like glycosyltransferase
MDGILWGIRAGDSFTVVWAMLIVIMVQYLQYNVDLILLFFRKWVKILLDREDTYQLPEAAPHGLIIIPSLLRNEEDYTSIISSIESCATNQYPGKLLLVTSIDGRHENPKLFQQLVDWVATKNYPNVECHVTSREVRGSKMMAIEAGAEYVKHLVSQGKYPCMPDIYFSVDADTTLGEHALEHLVAKLLTRHPLTRNYRKVVAGKPCTHPHEMWQKWRKFFTVNGQIYINVARQFLMYNIRRYNWDIVPLVALPGALYVTWTHVLFQAPRYMGYLQTITLLDWIKWWFGIAPPKFSDSDPVPLPQALTGSTDDTSIAVVVASSQWIDGKLSFDFPVTPMHALKRMLHELCFERSLEYAPEARAFTYTPPTFKGLWTQRVRWNSSRVECASRFTKSFLFNWQAGFPFLFQLSRILMSVVIGSFYFVILPFVMMSDRNILYWYLVGYVFELLANASRVVVALFLEEERVKSGFWRTIYCLPVANLFDFIFGFVVSTYGIAKDVLWQGMNTFFVPAHTLVAGKSYRIALFYRCKRFVSMCLRSVRYGDVPVGWWWLGWHAKEPYVENGYAHWSKGKKSQYVLK